MTNSDDPAKILIVTAPLEWGTDEDVLDELMKFDWTGVVRLYTGGRETGPEAFAVNESKAFGWTTVVYPFPGGNAPKGAGPRRNREMVGDAMAKAQDLGAEVIVLAFGDGSDKAVNSVASVAEEAGAEIRWIPERVAQ